MLKTQRNQTFAPLCVAMAILAVVLLIFYPLSVGPAARLCYSVNSPALFSVYVAIYNPLFWLRGQNTTFAEVSDWYVNLFLEDIPLRRC